MLPKIAFGRKGTPIGELIAGLECESSWMVPEGAVEIPARLTREKTVFLFGAHWSAESVAELARGPGRVWSIVPQGSAPYAEIAGVETVHLEDASAPVDWAAHGDTYRSELRRSRQIPGRTEDDEYFRRGLEAEAGERGVEAWCRARKSIDGAFDPWRDHAPAFVGAGRAIVAGDETAARVTVAEHSLLVAAGGLRLLTVVGPWSPVEPYLAALEAAAARWGFDGALLVRYSARRGATTFSGRSLGGASFAFLHEPPFCAAAPRAADAANAISVQVKGYVALPAPEGRLEPCVEATRAASGPAHSPHSTS